MKHDQQCHLSQEGCACIAHVVSATLVPPVEVPSEEEPVKGAEVPQE